MKVINVSTDFYPRPAGRFYGDGEYSGEKFRKEHLIPIIKSMNQDETLTVDFSGVTMAGSSFLEESFGGLVRKEKIDKQWLLNNLTIISPRKIISKRIIEYINDARPSN